MPQIAPAYVASMHIITGWSRRERRRWSRCWSWWRRYHRELRVSLHLGEACVCQSIWLCATKALVTRSSRLLLLDLRCCVFDLSSVHAVQEPTFPFRDECERSVFRHGLLSFAKTLQKAAKVTVATLSSRV